MCRTRAPWGTRCREQFAGAYFVWREELWDAKPSTLLEHRYQLAEPDTPEQVRLGRLARA